MFRIYLLIISLFFYSNGFYAQEYWDNFKKIDNNQGLSLNGITTIFQDRSGYMWFGTQYGLNRYDGMNIKNYYAGNSLNELSDNIIVSILQDLSGNIWIATEQGITVFNPITEKFFNLKKYNSNNSVFSQNILSIKLIDGKIMLTTSKGLWSINPGTILFTPDNIESIFKNSIHYKLDKSINTESIKIGCKDKNENYWLTTKSEVIIAKIISNQLVVQEKIRIDPSVDVTISTFFQDNFLNNWIGTQDNGLYHTKENKGTYLVTKIYPKNNSTNRFSRISNIIQDRDNNLIATSRGDGAILITKELLKNNNFANSTFNPIDLQTQKIKSIYLSRDKTLWVGSLGNGVFYQNNSSLKFKNFQIKDKQNNAIVNNTRSITKDSFGNLWMGTLFEGIYIYDTANQKVVQNLFKGKSVFSLSKIDNNHIMAGTSDGLYIVTFDKNNFSTKKLNSNNKIDAIVFSITHAKNQYWIGTDKNLISFTLTNDLEIANIVNYKNKIINTTNSKSFIRVVKYDPKHNILWVGSQTMGLLMAKLNTDFTIKEFYNINNYSDKIEKNEYICDISIGNKNNCWIGTRKGLIEIKLSKNRAISEIKKFTVSDGLPSNLIQSIQSDIQGDLWIGTNRGLVKLNQFYSVNNYDKNDGLQDNEFSEHSSYSDTDGLLYFGGIRGVSKLAPKQIKYSNYTEPVNLKDIIVNGINANNRRPINDSLPLSLSHNERNLKINFLSPNYANPKNCKYSYILEGFDKEWTFTTSNIYFAGYKNLPTGNYTFKIKASNEDGTWNANYTSLKIEIRPSFWISFTAIVLYLIILYVLVYIISTITKKRLENKNKAKLEKQYHEQMEKVNESKLEFFINISHEIRTPLTLILCSIEKLISNFKLNPKQEKEALTIDKNVNTLLELTNELLAIHKMETGNYQLKVQKNDIILFLKDIKIAFKVLAKSKDIKISIDAYQPEVLIWFDRNALGKIIYNLVSNAIKHTNKGGKIAIKISPSSNNRFLVIDVIDNGEGIEANFLSKIFDRFYHHGGNMDRYVSGFGIGLSLTKTLIELHKGSISVSSKLHIGSVFSLNLPFDESVYSTEEKSDRTLWDNDLPNALSNTNFDESIADSTPKLVDENIEINAEKPIILYVDDNIELLENMADYFSEYYNIYTAENGEIGVEMANKLQPDVIISDIVMPIMNGLELCVKIKNDINTSHIPVILLTAQGDMDSQFKGVQSGADYFVPKPFNVKLLKLTVNNLITSRNRFKNLFISTKYDDAGDITTNSKDKEFIDKLLNYVNNHIEEDNLNILNIANEFSMSRSTFFRKVKVITGTTGKEFIDSVRLKKATSLLIESDLNISEIAYAIGHSNPQYFSKWFKSHCNMSPSEYILKNKK